MRVQSDGDIELWAGSQTVGQRVPLRVDTGLYLVQYGPGGAKKWQARYKVGDKWERTEFASWPDWPLARARAFAIALRNGPQPYAPTGQTYRGRAFKARTLGEVTVDFLRHPWGAWMACGRNFDEVQAVDEFLVQHLLSTPLWLRSIRTVSAVQVEGLVDFCRSAAGEAQAQALLGHIQAILRYAKERREIAGSHVLDLQLKPLDAPAPLPVAKLDPRFPVQPGLDFSRLGPQILRDSDGAPGAWQIKLAQRALAYTVQKPQYVVAMRWDDLDLERGLWRAPRRVSYAGLKVSLDAIPLTTQMLTMLRGLKRESEYVFPATTRLDACLDKTSIRNFLRRQLLRNGQFTLSSWRSGFTSWSQSCELYDAECLAFVLGQGIVAPGDSVTEARTRALLQAWANYLTGGEAAARRRH